MKNNWVNIKLNKDILKRKYFLKKELKNIILKHLIRNQNTTPLLRIYSNLSLVLKLKKKHAISLQENRCVLTSKAKTSFKVTSLSRHSTKKLIDLGLIQNIKAETY